MIYKEIPVGRRFVYQDAVWRKTSDLGSLFGICNARNCHTLQQVNMNPQKDYDVILLPENESDKKFAEEFLKTQ